MTVEIKALEAELIEQITKLDAFKNKGFSVFNLEDLERLTESRGSSLPIVGVAYNGAVPVGNQADAKSHGAHAVQFAGFQFIVILAVQYAEAGQEDTKQAATDLLDQMRRQLVGYKSKNARGWRWMGERPEPEGSGDGIIFYSQLWETSAPFSGTASNS